MTVQLRHLQVGERSIAYRSRAGGSPTLVFFPGYASDMEGTKALALDAFAERRGLAMLRFDYSGTGSSSGHFEEGTLGLWLDESLAIADQLTEGPLILIGSASITPSSACFEFRSITGMRSRRSNGARSWDVGFPPIICPPSAACGCSPSRTSNQRRRQNRSGRRTAPTSTRR